MRVLVTGHNGYIGSVMTPLLKSAGHQVSGLDTYFFEHSTLGLVPVDVPATRVDIRDVELHHLSGLDAICHLAALSNDPLGDLEPEHTYAINHLASVRLAEMAKEVGVQRFIYSSSCSIYGASDTGALVDETTSMAPVTPYAESKVRVEADLHALADDTFSPVMMRNATAYGVSPRQRTDLVLNDLVASAMLSGEVKVLSDGTPWRPLIHIEDISRAFLAVLEAPVEAVHDQAFNVGSEDENYQVRELADIVAETVPDCTVNITGETGADPRSYRVSFGKIKEHVPDFRPQWTARSGVAELYQAFIESALTKNDATERFKRLPVLAGLREQGALDDTLRWSAVLQ